MAKVLGALFSEQARGKFGRVLSFRVGGRFPSVRASLPKRDPLTPPQLSIRKIYGLINADWRIASDTIRNYFRDLSVGKHMSGHNVFYQFAFRWIFDSRCGDTRCGFGRCSS